ncbi:hypothetical protein AYL99_01588 [Fonsecaea erecta]|uniref:D-xylose reductase [NAD(P)H] n=1 Tax=Fonsecaea erecta TaxID=1367422 RepID=A0A179A266_9EURO|nr:hypothetical protein AYL99_01588 [Fonsecaea erecta]OAP65616.1 hypothetical protein AYL99_01588 [Fonsecaea erecta]
MEPLTIKSTYQLNTGYEIPALGFGVYQTPADEAEKVVAHALKIGIRQIDSAPIYENEAPCGAAIRKSGIPRDQIFYVSKVWPNRMSYENAKKDVDTTLATAGLNYVDLYIIHAPYGGKEARCGAWKALVEAQKAGKVRSIGVSNYGVHHLEELKAYIAQLEKEGGEGAGGKISVGQWELHPWLARPDITEWCRQNGVLCQAYSPLARGQRMEEPVLHKLGEKYNKSPAQILVRWSLQKGFSPLPKSVSIKRIEENADVFDFELTDEDMAELDLKDVYAPSTWDPTTSHD